ncbi:hypothetical protein K504DRAFT_408484 [Pleomassaria siparia CBS 279.74]|uniref:Uncharacterized protein n=1 Tax=Pleomassaria siparia CBS 279.74 TaxID=1314801 RepID=A0A6G1K8B7_9PLEO|nr:hypothetical protein K504DRAFT_408484 [Pleomassaria siparia CBS 279.74]
MLMFDNVYVKRGLWTNWSQGTVMGKTITTDSRTGTVVVSILAILSSLALTHLWHLVAFTIHQFRAHGRSSADGLYWQQQAILRTQAAPSSLIAENVHLWWNWRNRANRVMLRCSMQNVLPTLFILGAVSTSITTSLIVDNSNIEALVSSSMCGKFQGDLDKEYLSALADASTCRNRFIRPFLPFVSQRSVCPFESSFCTDEYLPAISMDTGLLDLNENLGVNLGKSDAVKFRKKTTCAVIPINERIKIINVERPRDPWDVSIPTDSVTTIVEPVVAVYLGKSAAQPAGNQHVNATFTSPAHNSANFGFQAAQSSQKGFVEWEPLPGLMRKDGHVTIFEIDYSGITYEHAVDDPLFGAHRIATDKFNNTVYKPDLPVGVMGCVEQSQYCVSHSRIEQVCTELGNSETVLSSKDLTGARPIQLAALELLKDMPRLEYATTRRLNISAAVLPIPSAIPSTQWINEAESWTSYVLSMSQLVFSDYAMGPAARTPSIRDQVQPPRTDGEKALCNAQKLRKSGGFANINLFGLVFVVVICFTLLTLDLLLLPFLIITSKRRRGLLDSRLNRWIQDGVLQLQRRAFVAQGEGSWEKLENDIPVTSYGEKLSELHHSPSSPLYQKSDQEKAEGQDDFLLKKGFTRVKVKSIQVSVQTVEASTRTARALAQGAKEMLNWPRELYLKARCVLTQRRK